MQTYAQLGNANTTAAQSVSAAGSIGTAAIGTAASAGAISATTAALAIPIVGAVVAGVTIWLSSINRRNAQKSASTSVMYQIQEQAEKNLRGYLDGPRTVTSQRLALQNIDALIGMLKSPQGCGNPDLGDAGRRCWQERATPEGIYSWYGAFRDPIANDKPNPDPPGVIGSAVDALSSFGGQLFGETDGQPSQWPLWVAIAAAAVALSE